MVAFPPPPSWKTKELCEMLNGSSDEFQAICEPLYSSTALWLVEHLMQVAWTKHCWFLSPLWFPRVWCGVPHLAGDLILLVEIWIFLSGWSKQSFVSNSSSMCHIGQFPHVSWLSQAKDSQQKNNSHIHVYTDTHMQNQPFALNARKINMIFTASPTHAPSVIVTTLTSLMGLLPEPVWQQCATYTMGVLFFSNSVFMRFLWQLQKAVILTH